MKLDRQKSHELQWLELLEKRGGLGEEKTIALNRLSRGYYGEVKFDQLCIMLLSKQKYYLNDLTLKYKNTIIQIDKIIFAEAKIYIIDMKYYFTDFTYRNNECYIGKKKMQKNIIEQLRNAVRLVENILHDGNIKKEVQGVLTFMNPDYSIDIEEEIELRVLEYHQVMGWIAQLEKVTTTDNQSAQKILNHQISNFKTRYVCSEKQFSSLKKGSLCEKCSKNITFRKGYYYHCQCGEIELLEKAVLRTICEAGTINHHKPLRKSDVKILMGKNYDSRYVRHILKKHFTIINKGKYASYKNPGVIYEYYKPQFYDKSRLKS